MHASTLTAMRFLHIIQSPWIKGEVTTLRFQMPLEEHILDGKCMSIEEQETSRELPCSILPGFPALL